MDFGLGSLAPEKGKSTKPSDLEFIYYLFWERGISLREVNELPIPYIYSVLSSLGHIKEEEQKSLNRR